MKSGAVPPGGKVSPIPRLLAEVGLAKTGRKNLGSPPRWPSVATSASRQGIGLSLSTSEPSAAVRLRTRTSGSGFVARLTEVWW